MQVETLRKQWDARAASAPLHRMMTFDGDDVVLGAGTKLAVAKRLARASETDPSEEGTRLVALLSAAYRRPINITVLRYIERAMIKRSEGDTVLALTHLALTGLPRISHAEQDSRRLFMADGLMRAGVTARTILKALDLDDGLVTELERRYNPDQPRIPAGNGRQSGQWTDGDAVGDEAVDASSAPPTSESDTSAHSDRPIQIADASSNWAQYFNPIGEAEAATTGRPPYNGQATNNQHKAGVALAVAEMIANGYPVLGIEVAVAVPGFPTPRVYDFVVLDPSNGQVSGVEVKTTLYDTIFFDRSQVEKDVAIYATSGGRAATLPAPVTRVIYMTYCRGCAAIDLRSLSLRSQLQGVGIKIQTDIHSLP